MPAKELLIIFLHSFKDIQKYCFLARSRNENYWDESSRYLKYQHQIKEKFPKENIRIIEGNRREWIWHEAMQKLSSPFVLGDNCNPPHPNHSSQSAVSLCPCFCLHKTLRKSDLNQDLNGYKVANINSFCGPLNGVVRRCAASENCFIDWTASFRNLILQVFLIL